ncbi:MAG: M20/M25/M40 family metallo-hydrolase [Thermodesulfovibrionales bacterium]|nr:M20/M25/M40 family metallo-hydrolase [Thermodesulfovibrionales bacterium]
MQQIFLLRTGLSNFRIVFLLSGIFFLAISLYPAFAEKNSVTEITVQHELIHHEIKVVLLPESHRIKAIDTISLPPGRPAGINFILHAGLQPLSESPGVRVTKDRTLSQDKLTEAFSVNLPPGVNTFTIRYGGVVNHPIEQYGKEYARGISQTPGLIADEGIYLAGSSYWYPRFQYENVTFSLAVELPSPWDAVSQGERTLHEKKDGKTFVAWESSKPQEEIYLIAGKFELYEKQKDGFSAMVFLRSPDKELADRYLDGTIRYIALYEYMIGPYPYKKFALVENFWETGFGMPSFTLLGPKVLRFPFILKSSYPHEILHTWWGNTVFPEYAKGNWSEGLTAYLSDHLMKEQDGFGTEHRLTTLQKYSDYVLHERDFPLTEFRSRHSSVSEAVGYGKSLMFFHMLRLQLGDDIFLAALREVYRNYKFHIASFTELQKSFETVSGKNLDREFDQWIHRPGAPALQVNNVRSRKDEGGYILTAGIHQVQDGAPYLLTIPIAVTMEGHQKTFQTLVVMDKKTLALKLHVPARPLRADIDPEFDLFRKLDRDETPPALSQALGSRKMLVILPASAESALLQAYRSFSAMFKTAGPDEVEIRLDTEITQIPGDRAVTVLGWDNRFSPKMLTGLTPYGISFTQEKLVIGTKEFDRKDHTFVFTARNPEDKSLVLTFIATDLPHALSGLGRKLPHYHKYSYLIFEGEEPENIAKDRWPVIDSPMTVFLPDEQGKTQKVNRGELMLRKPLAEFPAEFSSDRMLETIRYLSDREQEGRGFGSPGLDRTAEFIAQRFREAGLKPFGDSPGSYFQTWNETGVEPRTNITVKNIIGYIPGEKQEFSGQSVIVGAHYDHLGLGWPDAREGNKGKVHPGADDNASGVAVLIELAQVLAPAFTPDRSILFIAFTGEESGKRGSHYYVKTSAEEKQSRMSHPVEKTVGMINLDTVGRLKGKKLLILGGDSAREWVHIFRGAGHVSGVEIEMVQEDLDSSDQASFQSAGVPAVQLFTGAHADYHRPSDTADKIDAQGLIKVASAAREVIQYLAKRESGLSATITPRDMIPEKDREKRKVSLGIVPDFSYRGKGIRLSGTVPGSPAEKSGLTQGDILIRVHSSVVDTLKDLADILSAYKPGTPVALTILREGQETTVEAELAYR